VKGAAGQRFGGSIDCGQSAAGDLHHLHAADAAAAQLLACLLVFLTGPLGVAGAAMALLLLGRPLGFVANLGIIALFGMIIRNSVILIDQIEQDIRRPAWMPSSNRRCGVAVPSC
jgi:hypothetical protein